MTKDTLKFTKDKIDKLPTPVRGRKYYKDTEEKGLQLYITSNGIKTFCFRKKIQLKSYIKTFGRYGDISIDSARKQCIKAKAELSENINTFDKKNVAKENQTLKEAILEYIELHSKRHKREKTVKEELRYIELYLSKISKQQSSSISKEDIIRLHGYISDNNGLYMANRIIEFLRAMFNWKIDNQNWNYQNPAARIKLNKETKKDRFLQKDEKERFVKALANEPNELARDFFYIALLTGVRRGNILAMKWEEIDFKQKIWRVPRTKNDEPHNAPLLDEVIEILNNRKARNPKLGYSNSPFVLPSKISTSGHFTEPKRAWQRILKNAEIENLTIHDLRRTMGSYMTMQGTNIQTVGKVLGHKNSASTLIYSRLDVDTAREAMKNAGREILGKE